MITLDVSNFFLQSFNCDRVSRSKHSRVLFFAFDVKIDNSFGAATTKLRGLCIGFLMRPVTGNPLM